MTSKEVCGLLLEFDEVYLVGTSALEFLAGKPISKTIEIYLDDTTSMTMSVISDFLRVNGYIVTLEDSRELERFTEKLYECGVARGVPDREQYSVVLDVMIPKKGVRKNEYVRYIDVLSVMVNRYFDYGMYVKQTPEQIRKWITYARIHITTEEFDFIELPTVKFENRIQNWVVWCDMYKLFKKGWSSNRSNFYFCKPDSEEAKELQKNDNFVCMISHQPIETSFIVLRCCNKPIELDAFDALVRTTWLDNESYHSCIRCPMCRAETNVF